MVQAEELLILLARPGLFQWKEWLVRRHMLSYGRNVFMQKQLPPAFSNSDVSTTTGVRLSW